METASKLSREEMKMGIVKSFYQIWNNTMQQSNQRTIFGTRFVEQNLPLRNECALMKSAAERKGSTGITAKTTVLHRKQETRLVSGKMKMATLSLAIQDLQPKIILIQLDIRQKKPSACKKLVSMQCLLTELYYSKSLLRCIKPLQQQCSNLYTFGLDKFKPCSKSWRCLIVQTKATDEQWLD